jgi:hypothetical protein
MLGPGGHLLLATQRGLVAWDPSGANKTTRTPIAPLLFEAGARVVVGTSLDSLSVAPVQGGPAEDWTLRAAFSQGGAFVAFHAENATFAAAHDFKLKQLVVVVLRTDSGAVLSTLRTQIAVPSLPAYALGPDLSPSGRFLALRKPYQLEVFDLTSGRKVLSRADVGFSSRTKFLNDTTLLVGYDSGLDVVGLPSGKVLRSQRPAPTYSVSPDQTRAAILDKGGIRIWNLGTGAMTPGCKTQDRCALCTIEWMDDQRVRVFKLAELLQQEECLVDSATATLVPYKFGVAFQAEGFKVVESFEPGAGEPSRVLATLPNGGELSLGPMRKAYAASHGRLLVWGDSVRMFDSTGQLVLGE